jgi:phenylpyruvate tautomerase PptA (4-oxalocrotonate tautomerase family)
MPFITVKVPKKEMKLDVAKLGKDISEKANLEIHRVNLMVEYFDKDTMFKGAGNDYPAVHLAAGAGNGLEFIQNLAKTTANLVEEQLGLPENSMFAYCHPIEKGYLLVGGEFR